MFILADPELEIPPAKKKKCPLKRERLKRQNWSSKHQSSGDTVDGSEIPKPVVNNGINLSPGEFVGFMLAIYSSIHIGLVY